MGVLAPLLIGLLWVILIRVWSAGFRVDSAVSWFAGEGRGLRGHHAGLGPGVISMTTGWLGYILSEGFGIDSYDDGPWALAVNILFLVCGAFMLLMFWMWIVQWPKVLIPPQFRE
jgi:hypothetical protein